MVHVWVPNYIIQQVFNFEVTRMIIRYYFLTRSVFLFTRDNMLMWASDWLIAPRLSFLMVGFSVILY